MDRYMIRILSQLYILNFTQIRMIQARFPQVVLLLQAFAFTPLPSPLGDEFRFQLNDFYKLE